MVFLGEQLPVELLREGVFGDTDVALFSAGSGTSKIFAPKAVAQGAMVVDNSSAFRQLAHVPLVVPEINGERIADHQGIIANPNCTTIVTLMAVAPLHRTAVVRSMIVDSYQAASGAGAQALAELDAQSAAMASGSEPRAELFAHVLASNLIPKIGDMDACGYTTEELKMVHESRRILEAPQLVVSATCVRVPVRRAHAVAVHLRTEKPLSAQQAQELLREAVGVELLDAPCEESYPMPLSVSGRDEVVVGRVRQQLGDPHGIALWAVGDQLLKGAALNAVQIAELVVGHSPREEAS